MARYGFLFFILVILSQLILNFSFAGGIVYHNPDAEDPAKTDYRPSANLLTKVLQEEGGVSDITRFNLTEKLRKKLVDSVGGAYSSDHPLSDQSVLMGWRLFSPQSAPYLVEVLETLSMSRFNNIRIIGEAGVGKSHLVEQIVAFLSFGMLSEPLLELMNLNIDKMRADFNNESPFGRARRAFIGNTDFILVDHEFLNIDLRRKDAVMPAQEERIKLLLKKVFTAAKDEFKRSGRRTVFIFDEVGELTELVPKTIKSLLDHSGFRDQNDALLRLDDSGYAAIIMTTPEEEHVWIGGEAARDRRFHRLHFPEPEESEVLRILEPHILEWENQFQLTVDIDAIKLLIYLRGLLTRPQLAMPASIIKAVNRLFIKYASQKKRNERITHDDALRFLVSEAKLPRCWLPGPRGEMPFTHLEDEIKQYFVGDDELVGRIAESFRTWAILGFGPRNVPVWFIGGPTNSGKDTLVKALNLAIFGHDGSTLNYSVAGKEGHGMDALLVGPPLGNHNDNRPGLIQKALKNQPHGLIVLNEAHQLPTDEFAQFKVMVERGQIDPQGQDNRAISLTFNPIVFLGQWGETLTEDPRTLSQDEIDQIFSAGFSNGATGAVERAVLDRAHRTGGVILLKPVAREDFPKIARIQIEQILKDLKIRSNFRVTVERSLDDLISEVAVKMNKGPRVMEGIANAFIRSAIVKLIRLDSLPRSDADIRIRSVKNPSTQQNDVVIEWLDSAYIEGTTRLTPQGAVMDAVFTEWYKVSELIVSQSSQQKTCANPDALLTSSPVPLRTEPLGP